MSQQGVSLDLGSILESYTKKAKQPRETMREFVTNKRLTARRVKPACGPTHSPITDHKQTPWDKDPKCNPTHTHAPAFSYKPAPPWHLPRYLEPSVPCGMHLQPPGGGTWNLPLHALLACVRNSATVQAPGTGTWNPAGWQGVYVPVRAAWLARGPSGSGDGAGGAARPAAAPGVVGIRTPRVPTLHERRHGSPGLSG